MNTTGYRILCVDDEPVNLKLLEAMLEPRGYEVIKAFNGKDALNLIARERVDIVLLDVMMPEINGFDVCRILKSDERFRLIPIIMITALTSKQDKIRGIEAGAEDFITKPFDHGEVLARVKMLLGIKQLNDRLNAAYSHINNLVVLGEQTVKEFSPLSFEFLPRVDSMIEQIISRSPESHEQPREMVVGIFNNELSRWQWYHYRVTGGTLRCLEIHDELRGLSIIPGRGLSKTIIVNEADTCADELAGFLQSLPAQGILPVNFVMHLSSDLCVMAMNYGRDITSHDAAVLDSLAMQALFLKSLSGQVRETEDAFIYTVQALARASEVNDMDTGNHIVRVGEYCALLADRLGMSPDFVRAIRTQAQMHDVGKIHTPSEILKKPGSLTPEEWVEVKRHPLYGKRIIGDHVRLSMAANIAMSHHERWDGSGYPYGLGGHDIPLEGRIVTIADQYDALRDERPYKPALGHQAVVRILTEGDGRTLPSHFDPQVLAAFEGLEKRFEETYEELKG